MGHDQVFITVHFEGLIETYLLIIRKLVIGFAAEHGAASLINTAYAIGNIPWIGPIHFGRLNVMRTLVTLFDI